MSKRQRRFALAGALMGAAYLVHQTFPTLPEELVCFIMGMGAGIIVLNLLLTDERMERLCTWKRRALAQLMGRG